MTNAARPRIVPLPIGANTAVNVGRGVRRRPRSSTFAITPIGFVTTQPLPEHRAKQEARHQRENRRSRTAAAMTRGDMANGWPV